MRKLFLLAALFIPLTLFSQVGYVQEGNASFYGDEFEGRLTASGERYSHLKATCAHVSIPFGSLVKITNLENNKSAIARVNDRGPFVPDRIIDVSKSVAERLGMIKKGVVKVRIEVIDNQGNTLKDLNIASKPQKSTSIKKENHTIQGNINQVDVKERNDINLFSVQVSRTFSKGFYIQLGSYKEQNNLFDFLYEARKRAGKNTYVNVVQANNERLFKVLLGPFSTRNDAEKTRQSLLEDYPGCFIIKI
ncbi:septal ring lytic transglycosylase RlpA family protein [Tenuifilum thalassicum]|uniref:Probable endolytic peptidoglycan transglycosylase RlpA n=1 Tax=Tenuifilum thalassicum TaxID=2590900 RepID=A0A7D4BY53_9BACT|nr:SPOR domain-containing protein [Tenuifilum thalassicum]QKG78844.1 septal ring lytic transglycosylase RlpA family protein [Tenuifilum thalassicum]